MDYYQFNKYLLFFPKTNKIWRIKNLSENMHKLVAKEEDNSRKYHTLINFFWELDYHSLKLILDWDEKHCERVT